MNIKSDKIKVLQYFTFIIIFIIFVFITFPKMINHIPNQDESQNYMVSYFLNIQNFKDALASHGHAILWYLLIMPFAKTGIFYPYSMLIINYICIFAALIVMWKRAPFNEYIKIVITFSFMIVSYFSIYARCYSIGILLLFLLATMYKQRLKDPIKYSILLGLTANTSAIATIGATGLLFPFLHDLIKNKDNFTPPTKLL